jgi:hypothetical protein
MAYDNFSPMLQHARRYSSPTALKVTKPSNDGKAYIRAGPLKSFLFMESQYAYQRGSSTEAALHDLVQKIKGTLNQKKFAQSVFLDIDGAGAFDNVSFG